MYTVPVSNIALNQQQTEIANIATEPFSATQNFARNPRQNDAKNDKNGK